MKTRIFSSMLFLLTTHAFASQEFVAINGAATPLGGSLYGISGEVADVTAGLDLAEARIVSLGQVKLVVPPHLEVRIAACPGGAGAFLAASGDGDLFQPNARWETSGIETTLLLFDFLCAKDAVPNGKPSPFSR